MCIRLPEQGLIPKLTPVHSEIYEARDIVDCPRIPFRKEKAAASVEAAAFTGNILHPKADYQEGTPLFSKGEFLDTLNNILLK